MNISRNPPSAHMPARIACKWSPSLGALDCGTSASSVWGTEDYVFPRDRNTPTVFFGCYSLRDYLSVYLHKGHKWILWAGSDLRNLKNGFAFSDGKLYKLSKLTQGRFHNLIWRVLETADHYVENTTEADVLHALGINVSGVIPSFMGNVEQYKITFKFKERARAYISSGESRSIEYGFNQIIRIAPSLPWMDFYCYGDDSWNVHLPPNVINRGRVPKHVFNDETADMQIALSLNEFCGFSEVAAKGILRGHYAVSKVHHPKIPTYTNDLELIAELNFLRKLKTPNSLVRNMYKRFLNSYPWVCNAIS